MMEEDKKLNITGYKICYPKLLLTCLGVVSSCGVLALLFSWKKTLFTKFTNVECALDQAEKVIIVDSYGQAFVAKIIRPVSNKHNAFFFYKKIKYNWSEEESNFINIRGLDINTCKDIFSFYKGLDSRNVKTKQDIYGPNSIDIQVKSVLSLLLREIKNPFYLYQSICVLIWCLQFYYIFAISMVLLSVISVSATVWETRKQSKTLRDAMQLKSKATVLRDGKETTIESEELCPGDVMILSSSSFVMPCDAVLLSGTCVVNESMLTGESTPITKVPLSGDLDETFNPMALHKRSLLSCGTEVLLGRSTGNSKVKAVVYRTGFSTAKGELVRAILYPKPVKLKLYSDFLKCSFVCFAIGILPITYTGLVSSKLGAHPYDGVLFCFNVVTFFFPPALPAVLTSINEQAQRRLRNHGIFCLNTRYIHFAGGLDVVCFDKTGTLTEDSLDILSVVPVQEARFEEAVENIEDLSPDLLLTAMATCHSLSKLNDVLLGYGLDIKMFNATGWDLRELSTGNEQLCDDIRPPREVFPKHFQDKNLASFGILKQFPFESVLRRTTVVTASEEKFRAFLKGSPELVVSLCQADTVPDNSREMIDYYSSQGYRIIGMATKLLTNCTSSKEAMDLSREELESGMHFLGLVVLENKLKSETIPALNLLKEANIRSIMITGDNLLTAITVGRKCGMVEENDFLFTLDAKLSPNATYESNKVRLDVSYKCEKPGSYRKDILANKGINEQETLLNLEHDSKVAIDGTTFNLLRNYDMDLLEKVVVKGAIFARMLPEDKLFLIEHFQSLGYQVGMCGDGANDCGALKTAHTGVSLSVAEASVAAPFTSKQPNIQCMSTLIREGRATLVSTFDSFKYMMCYTFTFLVGVLFLFWEGQRPSDGAYVFIDMILNLAPPFLIGATTAYAGLAKKPPPRSILNFPTIFSLFSFITIQVVMHVLAYSFVQSQYWYEPFTFKIDDPHSPEASYSGATILSINMVAYLAAAAAFPTGPPYRNGFFSNKKFIGLFFLEFIVVAVLIIYPPDFMISFLNFKRGPDISFYIKLYAISLGGFIFFILYERVFVQRILTKYVIPQFKQSKSRKIFQIIQETLRDWPQVEEDECVKNELSNGFESSSL